MADDPKIGLALSGGGSRAIAFHLGCLRALHDRGVLDQVSVLSCVSGGSVVGAIYAYSDSSFADFETQVQALLKRGFTRRIIVETFLSCETFRIVASLVTSGIAALAIYLLTRPIRFAISLGLLPRSVLTWLRRLQAPLPRFASRTTAFEKVLRNDIFGQRRLDEVQCPDLSVVINACEIQTETAFRFGSQESGNWRFGRLDGGAGRVSKAVAASASYPALLPALDEELTFRKNDSVTKARVIITDGGIYDNLGITCLLPGRDASYSTNVFDVDYIICCDAGVGVPQGSSRPYFWGGRMYASISAMHRRTHAMSYDLLHRLTRDGELKGFILPYLGQQDSCLPEKPADFVSKEQVSNYPTDFSPMSATDMQLLGKRGEQLTTILLNHYLPDL